MARINIYVPDELKARMDKVGDAVNWSEVTRPAIQAALTKYEHKKGQNMQTAVERLRASKEVAMAGEREEGWAEGRRWAENLAEYKQLVRVSKIEVGRCINVFEALAEALDLEGGIRDLVDNLPPEPEAFLEAFVEGAQEFFEEVREEL
jgi:hypothetical protein